MGKLPRQKDGILMRIIGQEAMLYDKNREMVHILNDTAAIVWQNCDGNTEIENVVQKLAYMYDLSVENNVVKDIEDILEKFTKLNLLSNTYVE